MPFLKQNVKLFQQEGYHLKKKKRQEMLQKLAKNFTEPRHYILSRLMYDGGA